MVRTMEWAARANHMAGIPRKLIFMAGGAFAKIVATLVNSTTVHNADALIDLARSRPPGVPLITVSNHMSTVDDPVMWGFKGFPSTNAKLARWVLTAEDICFKNTSIYCLRWEDSQFLGTNKNCIIIYSLRKCIPIRRGGGIYQEHMNEVLERLTEGAWLHTFPEGKVSQEDDPIRRLKWGTASLIVRAPVTPIVLPIVHRGLQEVMPEKFLFGKRPPVPLCNKQIKIIIGEPMEFDLPLLMQTAISKSRDLSFSRIGWPTISHHGLDEAAQRFLYSIISEKIQTVMESLRRFGQTFSKSWIDTKNSF